MIILIIDDDKEIVEFISLAFEIGWPGSRVISAHQGRRGLDLMESETPDVVILDLGLPDISGFEVLKQIRLFSTVPIIIVSVRDTESDIVKGLEWGADEYINKPFGQLELLSRVRATLRSRAYSSGDELPITVGRLHLDTSSGQLICNSKKIHLTQTETVIANLLMKKLNQVVTYSELATSIWGEEYPSANDAIRVYIRRLRRKIAVDKENYALIKAVQGKGYSLELPAKSSTENN